MTVIGEPLKLTQTCPSSFDGIDVKLKPGGGQNSMSISYL